MEIDKQKPTDGKCIKISHLENKVGVEFCIDNLLNQLNDKGFIRGIINRYVVRWPRGLGVECVDTECFVLLTNEHDMESLMHYLDGYRFHDKHNILKTEWGWFTFNNVYKPLLITRSCTECDSTFKDYVSKIENKLLSASLDQ